MTQEQILDHYFFSKVIGNRIHDSEGKFIGKVHDMAVRWDDSYPIVTCIQFAKTPNRQVEIAQIAEWSESGLCLKDKWEKTPVRALEYDEIYVGRWLLDKQIIDINGSKLVRVNDVTFSLVSRSNTKELVLIGVDVGIRGLFRRIGLEFLVKSRPQKFIDWQNIKPLDSKAVNLHLRDVFSQLDALHPADIADILEKLGPSRSKDILIILRDKKAADVLSKLDFLTRKEIIKAMGNQRASKILKEMTPNKIANILRALPNEKKDQILDLMEPECIEQMKKIVIYPEKTVGSLLATDYVTLTDQIRVEEAMVQLKEFATKIGRIYYIYVVNDLNVLQGVLSLRALITSNPRETLNEIMCNHVISICPLEDKRKAVDLVAKYSLLALPVVDEQKQMLGIINADDLLNMVVAESGNLRTFTSFMTASRKGWTR